MNIDSYFTNYDGRLKQFMSLVGRSYIADSTVVNRIIKFKNEPNHKVWRLNDIKITSREFNDIKHIRPRKTDIKAVSFSIEWGIYNSVFYSNCSFRIEGQCNDESWPRTILNSFHVDAEVVPKDEDHVDTYYHPLHHLQFGGKNIYEMEKSMDDEDVDKMYGNMMILEAPRLIHPPLDAILCIDFVLTYFLPIKTTKSIRQKGLYRQSVMYSQSIIWKPYFDSISKYFSSKSVTDQEKKVAHKLIPQLYSYE